MRTGPRIEIDAWIDVPGDISTLSVWYKAYCCSYLHTSGDSALAAQHLADHLEGVHDKKINWHEIPIPKIKLCQPCQGQGCTKCNMRGWMEE